jgi:2-dehydro-3-deoxyphosphogluconate aldolase/(4S)-4-hydroxy-2-oxoglutarate aldolase
VTATAPLRTPDQRRAATDAVLACGAVAVVRLPDARHTLQAVDAIVAGGITAVELTLTTPGALDVVAALARRHQGALLVGAGSVLDADAARRAIDAGAAFVVSPVFRAAVVAEAQRHGVPAMPGAFTPTEILDAHEAGADVVKLFPADTLGPAFIKGVLGPMPFLRLMPTGGVTPENVGAWLRAGAAAVGLGSALVDPRLAAAGDFAALRERARVTVAGVAAAREVGA